MMTRTWFRAGLCALAVALVFCAGSASDAQVNVTTYHFDNSRSGQNSQESILSPANVNSSLFGKLFTDSVDGYVYAQPLYLSGVSIHGGTHNVLYVATEHDSVYAVDADSGAVYWQVSLIPAGGTTVSSNGDLGCGDLTPEVGITGTPVIDTTTGTLYVLVKSKVNGSIVQYLHAIDVVSAQEKFGGPQIIQATVPGTAADGDGTTLTFSPHAENQRAALLLVNGHVVIAWSSHCDIYPWHGWVMSYSASTLAQEAVFNTSRNGYGNGVWMSGGGAGADTAGNVYFATGNGTWNGAGDLGDSIVKLGPPTGNGFSSVDYFTPYNQNNLDNEDGDVAAGGVLLLPTLANGKQLVVGMGKEGKIYLLDRTNLGKYCVNQTPACSGNDPQIVQEVPYAMEGVWGTPAYWNGRLYWGGGADNSSTAESLKAFSFNANGSGLISTSAVSSSPQQFLFSGPVPSISANGATNGIVWGLKDSAAYQTCVGSSNCQVLYAYDATNLGTMLYNSGQAGGNRDVPGGAIKFATPIIANGKVYVGSQYAVSAYGLLSGAPPPPAPTPQVSVSLAKVDNVYGIAADGTAPTHGGIDGYDYAISSNIVGSSVTWGALTFSLGAAGGADAVSQSTIALPAGNFTTLNLLGLAVNGNQLNQSFVVTYTDGTTTTIKQSMSDWWTPSGFAGETTVVNMGYRVTPSGGQSVGTTGLYGYAFAINSAKSVKSVTLPSNRNVIILGAVLSGQTGTTAPTSPSPTTGVAFGAAANVYGIFTNGTVPSNGGLDSHGYAISSSLVGSTVTWSGLTFTLGGVGAADAASSNTITLPSGNFAALNLLALGANGNQTNQTFVVTYTDGTTTSIKQSLSDWWYPQNYAGESTAVNMAYCITSTGAECGGATAIYGYTFAINSAKTVKSLTLPNNRSVVVLAAVLSGQTATPVAPPPVTPPPTAPATVALGGVDNVFGIFNNGAVPTGGGLDSHDYAISSGLVGATVTWAGLTFTLGGIGVADAVSSATVPLPAGNYSSLNLLALGTNGNQPNQSFVVTYTDGSTTSISQSLSDWWGYQGYAGELVAVNMPYCITYNGGHCPGPTAIYGYSFAINNAKTVQSLTLPGNRNVVVLAAVLKP